MPSERLRNSLETSTAKYEKSLSLASTYLAGRGITEETARRFRLGYVDDPADDFRECVCIPYLRRSVGVASQRFRRTNDSVRPKYLGRTGVASGLFHVEAFFGDNDFIVITEGEFDAIILDQLGIPATGVPGATSWKPHYRRLFEDFERVYVFRDNDDGKDINAAKDFADEIVRELDVPVVVQKMPHEDVNATFLHPDFGPEYLRSLLDV